MTVELVVSWWRWWRPWQRMIQADELISSNSVQIAAPTSASRGGVVVVLVAMAELVTVVEQVMTYPGPRSQAWLFNSIQELLAITIK